MTRGRERKATRYTREGSAAHVVAEAALTGQTFTGKSVWIDGEDVPIDEDMHHHAALYREYVELVSAAAIDQVVEERVTLSLPSTEPLFGTLDYGCASNDALDIIDYKYGRGHAVSPERNPQLMIYALGAMELLGLWELSASSPVRLHIVQPRADGEKIKVWETTVSSLQAWRDTVLTPALQRIDAGDTTENPGSHCRWCLRVQDCAAMRSQIQSLAKGVFSDEGFTPAPPDEISDEELARILDASETISVWVSKVRAEGAQRIEHGRTIPGWKLVPKRAIRKWVSETKAEEELRGLLPDDELYEAMVIRSPAQIETALKRRHKDTGVVADLVSKVSSGTTLVREQDEREAVEVETAQSVFDD